MEFKGEYNIPAEREQVWKLLNDPQVLQDCIPGCERFTGDPESGYEAVVRVGLGPMKLVFSADIKMTDMQPPSGYSMQVSGGAGDAGTGRADIKVTLSEQGEEETLLQYRALAQVQGKIARLGSRLINSSANLLARQFFGAFAKRAGGGTARPATDREASFGQLLGELGSVVTRLAGKSTRITMKQSRRVLNQFFPPGQSEVRHEEPAETQRPGTSRDGYQLSIKVNGAPQQLEIEARTLLVEVLRDHLGLTGTHVGCDTTQCGACTVLVNGSALKSCTTLAVTLPDAEIETIEGISRGNTLHPVQAAFREHHALQCGFCTPGMVMASIDLLRRHSGKVSEDQVRRGLEGNLCRCTGYQGIVNAVMAAAQEYPGDTGSSANREPDLEQEASQ